MIWGIDYDVNPDEIVTVFNNIHANIKSVREEKMNS